MHRIFVYEMEVPLSSATTEPKAIKANLEDWNKFRGLVPSMTVAMKLAPLVRLVKFYTGKSSVRVQEEAETGTTTGADFPHYARDLL